MGLAPLRGGWWRGGVPIPGGTIRWGFGGLGGKLPAVSLAHLGPRKPAGLPGQVLHPPRTPPAAWVLGEWEGGGEEEYR